VNIVEQMEDLADRLASDEIKATHDPAYAINNLPCLLVTPPVLASSTLTGAWEIEWQIVALSSRDAGTLDAVAELQVLVDHADQVAGITRAQPTRYVLTTAKPPVAAYLCTTTEYA
jgi:hypothetical protein